ncbi:hypothetical protein PINS_up002071 [Pythium insidiosum]|nr:hypothetical protein PINS_up002071 [Pythium insidiosum]
MLPIPVAAPALPAFNASSPGVLNAQVMGTGAVGTTEHPSGHGHSTLEVTGQPPSTWYKDQFGRKATFELRVRRENRGCYGCIEQRHLSVQLLYESGKIVENQSILRVASGLCLNKQDETILAIRIMEVSKNHQNQKFRLQICLPKCPLDPNHTSGASVITEPILVLSKKNKRQVKPEAENTKSKKSKFSPPTADEVVDLLGRTPTHAETAPPSQMFASVSELESVHGDGTLWETETVRFKKPSDGVCLWAKRGIQLPSASSMATSERSSDFKLSA